MCISIGIPLLQEVLSLRAFYIISIMTSCIYIIDIFDFIIDLGWIRISGETAAWVFVFTSCAMTMKNLIVRYNVSRHIGNEDIMNS